MPAEELLALLTEIADADPDRLALAAGPLVPLRGEGGELLRALPALRLLVAAVGGALRERPDLLPEAAALFTPELAEQLRALTAAYLLTTESSA